MREHGFDPCRNLILKSLETIVGRDALLNENGSDAIWHAANAIVGNPPFLGNKSLVRGLGQTHVEKLRKAFAGKTNADTDLVVYWVDKACCFLDDKKVQLAGFVTADLVRSGLNSLSLVALATQKQLYSAWSHEPWVLDRAAVRVSMICFANGQPKRFLNGH